MSTSIKDLERAHQTVQEAYDGLVESRNGNTGLTAADMIAQIKDALEPHFGHKLLRVTTGLRLGNADSVFVKYSSVTPEEHRQSNVAALNALSHPQFFISAPGRATAWPAGHPAPATVTVEHTSGQIAMDPTTYRSTIKFRKKSGSPEKVIKYLVDFFMKNKTALLNNDKRR